MEWRGVEWKIPWSSASHSPTPHEISVDFPAHASRKTGKRKENHFFAMDSHTEITPPSSPGREATITVSYGVQRYVANAVYQYRYILEKFVTKGEFVIFIQLLAWEAHAMTGVDRKTFIDYCEQECEAYRAFQMCTHLYHP